MSIYAVLTKDGRVVPADFTKWVREFKKNSQQRIIQQDDLYGFFVSTVFLGINHQYLPDRLPLWFETMIFDRWKGTYYHADRSLREALYMERCTTLAQAKKQHVEALAWLKAQPFFYQLALPE